MVIARLLCVKMRNVRRQTVFRVQIQWMALFDVVLCVMVDSATIAAILW